MPDFPEWLPEAVAKHFADKLASGALSEAQKECILRLATEYDMESAWKSFNRAGVTPDQLVDLIEFVRLHPSVMYPDAKNSKPTPANQRKVLTEIASLSERLQVALGKLDPIGAKASTGLATLTSSLRRLQTHVAALQEGDEVVVLHHLLEGLEEIDTAFGKVVVLQILQQAATCAKDTPTDGPRKQGAQSAARTALIQDLKRYMQLHFGRKLHEPVAILVNNAMGLYTDNVTIDMVRKA